MLKLVTISAILFVYRCAYAADYFCKFGPDAYGEYVEEIVDSGHAHHCGAFCECVGLNNNKCYFGPDDEGKFIIEVVSSELADSCDQNFCICDTHTFEEEDVTFETILEERKVKATDRTAKPHEEPKPVVFEEFKEDTTKPEN